MGDFKIEGTPDYVGNYRGVPAIIDFKTSSQIYSKDKLIVNEQLHLYAHLARQTYGFEAEKMVYLILCKNPVRIQVIERSLCKQEHEKVLDNIRQHIVELESRTTWPQNKQSCLQSGKYRCNMWEQCYG